MGIRQTSSPDFRGHKKRATDVSGAFTKTVMNFIRKKIIDRTQRGTDAKLKKFKPYSDGYVERYNKRGAGKPKSKDHVTLTDTSKMLNSIRVKKIKNGMKIWIPAKVSSEDGTTTESDKARFIQKHGRKFFNIDKKQRAYIKRRVGRFVVRGVK